MTMGPFILFCICYIFYTLGDFSFSLGDYAIPFYFIIGNLVLLYLLARNYKLVFSQIRTLLRTKAGKFLLFFIVWAIITIFISIPQGTFIFKEFFSNFIGNFIHSFLYPLLLTAILITQIKLNKKLKLFLFFLCMTIVIIGMIELIALNLNLDVIKQILSVFVNRTMIANDQTEKLFAMAGEKFRIESVFREPGEYAGFLTVSCPIFFYLGNLKEKLFKNQFIDIFLKKSLIVLWLFNLLETQSPINIIFVCIILGGWCVLNSKKINKNLLKVKYLIVLFISAISLIAIGAYSIYNQELFVQRIATSMTYLSSVDSLVENEPSLATRICTHEAQIRMGLDYPVFGVGYANMNSVWPKYLMNLPHNVTMEAYKYAVERKQKGGSSFMWKIFAETGFVGLFLLYAFWFTLFQGGLRAAKTSRDREFVIAFSYSVLIYIIYSWYLMLAPVFMVYAGVVLGSIIKDYKFRRIIRRIDK